MLVDTVTTTDFEACFRAEYPRLVALGVSMTRNREVARELAQETMLRAHDRWDEVGTYDSPAAWLRRVMANLLIDHHRSRDAERRATDRLRPVAEAPPADDRLGEDWATLIEPLPPQQRVIVSLYYGEDRSVDDIADTLEIAVGTVKSALAKARARLSDVLDDPGGEPTDG